MRRTLLLGVLAYLFVFVGLLTVQGMLVALAIPLFIYLVAGFLSSPENIDLDITRRLSESRVFSGTVVEVSLEIANGGSLLEDVTIVDRLPEGLEVMDGETSVSVSLKPGDSTSFHYKVRGMRGYYFFDDVLVIARDGLGLVQRRKNIQAPGEIFTLPISGKLRGIPIRPRRTLIYGGTVPTRQGGEGVDFFDVREYQPGDSLKAMNWKAHARRPDQLFTNEYEQERVADVGLILDGRVGSHPQVGQRSLFDISVQAAAALAEGFLNTGNRVGLLIYGAGLVWTYPGFGKLQREKIFLALAKAREGRSIVFEKLDSLPTRYFPRGSQIVLVSPLQKEDIPFLVRLRSRGYGLLVVSPDPVSFEAAAMPDEMVRDMAVRIAQLERATIVHKLQRGGVFTLDWDTSIPLEAVVNAGLGRMKAWTRHRGVI